MIDFYEEAFRFQLEKAQLTDSFKINEKSGQTWWLKEVCEFIALIGLVGAIIPAFNLLMKIPFFAKVRTEEEAGPVEKEKTKGRKITYAVIAIFTSLIPAYYFPVFINKTSELSIFTNLMETIMLICTVFVLAVWIMYFVSRMTKSKEDFEKSFGIAWYTTKVAIIISSVCMLVRALTINASNILPSNYWFNSDSGSQIGYWALISAAISILTMVIVHYIIRKKEGATVKSYGLAANIKQIGIALLISLILFVGIYLVVFVVGLLLNVDFRLWVYAIKSFEWQHVVSFLRYLPIYFIYYFVNSIVIANNTKDIKGWKGALYALFLNIGGLVILLAYQYGKLFLTGTAGFPSLALPGILLFGLVPSLALAAIFARKFYEKTNNVWTSAFFNTFLFTMIAIANTSIYLLSM